MYAGFRETAGAVAVEYQVSFCMILFSALASQIFPGYVKLLDVALLVFPYLNFNGELNP